jgi:hypothetical protein
MQERKTEIDFQSIDEKTKFKYQPAREMAAIRDGYKYISEHIVMVYRETRSLRETGKRCGGVSTIAVRSVLAKCGEMLRHPGGRVWSKLTEDDVKYIRSWKYMNNQIFIKVAKELSESATKRMGKPIKISSETIRDVWKRKTHKEVE